MYFIFANLCQIDNKCNNVAKLMRMGVGGLVKDGDGTQGRAHDFGFVG